MLRLENERKSLVFIRSYLNISALALIFIQNRFYSLRHSSSGLACSYDQDVFVIHEIIAMITDHQLRSCQNHVVLDGLDWIHGLESGLKYLHGMLA